MIDTAIDDKFESFAVALVREVKAGESLNEVTSSMSDSEQFEGSVMVDAAQNIGIRSFQIAPFGIVGISAGVYFLVDKDAGYAIGMLLLSALGIAGRS